MAIEMDNEPAPVDPAVPKRRGPGRPRLIEPSPEFVARQEEIVAAAATVFHEKGYDAGTLDDVADALDLRRASLYYYVRSKANLLYLIVTRALDVALARIDEHLTIPDPAERLEALIRHQVRTIAGEPSLFTVFFDQRPRLEDRYEAEIRERERRYLSLYTTAVEAAVAAGAMSATGSTSGPDLRYATQAILGMTTWSYKWFRPEHDDIKRLEDVCVAIILGTPAAPATQAGEQKPRPARRRAG